MNHIFRAGNLISLFLLVGSACTSQSIKGDVSPASSFLAGAQRGFVIGEVARSRNGAYFTALSKTGANVARIFFPFPKSGSAHQFTVMNDDLLMLMRVLSYAHAAGVSLVIVGDFAGVADPEFWSDADWRASFVANWSFLGKMIGNDPRVAGLDLLNEPNPQSSTGSLGEMQLIWSSLAEETIAALRREQISLPVIFESVAGAAALGFKDMRPLSDPQVVYSFHFYAPHEITHQQVSDAWPRSIPYPAGVEWSLGGWDPEIGVTEINKQRLEVEMRHVIAFQRRYALPIYVGEFSCVRWAPDGTAERYVADLLDIFTRHGWSWTYHEFRGWSGWDAEVASQDRDARARTDDAPIMRLLRAKLVRIAD